MMNTPKLMTKKRAVSWLLTTVMLVSTIIMLGATTPAEAATPGYGVVTVIYENEKTAEELKTVTSGQMAAGEMKGFDISAVGMEGYAINPDIFQAYPGQDDIKISQSNGIWSIQVPVTEGTRIVYVPFTKSGELPLREPRNVNNPNEEMLRSEIRVWLFHVDTGAMITTIPFTYEGVRGGTADFLPVEHGYTYVGIKPYGDTTDVREISGGIQIEVNKPSYIIELFVKEEGGAAAPTPAGKAAHPTASKIYVNGAETAFDAYNISDNNYFKLRDLACVLVDVFDVGYENGNVTLIPDRAYTANGQEMTLGVGTAKTAEVSTDKIYLDGAELALEVYKIDGNNYVKLRDLGRALDFGVEWRDNAVHIEAAIGYTPE